MFAKLMGSIVAGVILGTGALVAVTPAPPVEREAIHARTEVRAVLPALSLQGEARAEVAGKQQAPSEETAEASATTGARISLRDAYQQAREQGNRPLAAFRLALGLWLSARM